VDREAGTNRHIVGDEEPSGNGEANPFRPRFLFDLKRPLAQSLHFAQHNKILTSSRIV
jgi:hypothetical protein